LYDFPFLQLDYPDSTAVPLLSANGQEGAYLFIASQEVYRDEKIIKEKLPERDRLKNQILNFFDVVQKKVLKTKETGCNNNYIDLNWWNSNPYSGNCSAGYVILNATGIPGLVYIIDVSQVNNPFYTWNTSNGFMSNNPTPFFNLTGVATYTLCVTVTDTINGCNDTFCDSLSIDSLGNVGRNPIQTFSNSNASVGIAVISAPKSTSPTGINNIIRNEFANWEQFQPGKDGWVNRGTAVKFLGRLKQRYPDIKAELKYDNAFPGKAKIVYTESVKTINYKPTKQDINKQKAEVNKVIDHLLPKFPGVTVEWINENKDALAEKGYTLDMPYCSIGRLCLGKLIGDPWEEYQKLQKYSRVCRTSIVTVEE
jgi:hypothetical protein